MFVPVLQHLQHAAHLLARVDRVVVVDHKLVLRRPAFYDNFVDDDEHIISYESNGGASEPACSDHESEVDNNDGSPQINKKQWKAIQKRESRKQGSRRSKKEARYNGME